jgi:hypothetical protein
VITQGPGGYLRETIDPDDFKSGFGTWSGTSFAVPVMAGQLLQQLIDDGRLESAKGNGKAIPKTDAVNRGWAAVEKSLKDDVHPLKRP